MTNWMIRLALVLCAGTALLSTGCATIVSKSQYPVVIDNKPGPTYFSVHNHKNEVVCQGVTPQQVTLSAKSRPFTPAKYSVVFAGEEATSQRRELNAKFDPWLAGNIVFGGVPGIVVDGSTGAMFNLPERVVGGVDTQYAVTDNRRGSTLIAATMDSSSPSSVPNSARLNAKVGSDESRVVPASATTTVKASPHVSSENGR